MRIVWVQRARDDLVALRAFIGRDNPDAAAQIASRLIQAASRLSEQPQSGRPGRNSGTRELVVPDTPYIIPYRVRAGSIEILRVLHGAQRWPRRL